MTSSDDLLDMLAGPAWMREANCRGLSEIMFPVDGSGSHEAKAVCYGTSPILEELDRAYECPVRHECLIYALTRREKSGTWGGLSERDRRKQRSIEGAISASDSQCRRYQGRRPRSA